MSINIDSALNRMWKNYDTNKNSSTSTNTNQNSEISENIFAQAEKLVTEYNQKKKNIQRQILQSLPAILAEKVLLK